MNTQQQLDQAVERWALLRHPFYQAWQAGALPISALRTYAQEYGAFIAHLPRAWQTLDDPETAQEEAEHADLWAGFAEGLGTRVDGATIAQVRDLVDAASALFADPVSALGALYAFESQQPATAQSKLDGLRAHYRLPETIEPYFEVHRRNEHEAAKVLRRIERLPEADKQRAVQACGSMSFALWEALTGIHEQGGSIAAQ